MEKKGPFVAALVVNGLCEDILAGPLSREAEHSTCSAPLFWQADRFQAREDAFGDS
jgi:hypothetical protein